MSDKREQTPERLAVTSRLVDGVTVVAVKGEIDHDSAERFEHALGSAQGETPQRIVVDFDGVTFMDSTGIKALVATYHALQNTGGWIRIAAAAEPVLRVVQIVGVDRIIPCHPSVDQALAA
ncbi:STAS domain-containing protein [Streptomyces sp. NPDC051362]|uniref:STAS domain-containing protein n=1 Tax=Streptomyces sp. NPDC051362 TaxID=3365651 RepID=UPI0037A6D9C1